MAVTGGIGSGKSIVCRILAVMGYPVYDCDSRAKALMDADMALKERIANEVSAQALRKDGTLDRKALAAVVFSDAEALNKLNRLTHDAVRRDLMEWSRGHSGSEKLFVETAILYASGLDRMVGKVWEVTAPLETRISRVMARSGLGRNQVAERIKAQDKTESEPRRSHLFILNDGLAPLLPQVELLLQANQ